MDASASQAESSSEHATFLTLVREKFVPETWDGWHHSLGNNDTQLEKLRVISQSPDSIIPESV